MRHPSEPDVLWRRISRFRPCTPLSTRCFMRFRCNSSPIIRRCSWGPTWISRVTSPSLSRWSRRKAGRRICLVRAKWRSLRSGGAPRSTERQPGEKRDMTGDWRKLALAAAAAIALAATGVPPAAAQTAGKAGTKKAPAKDADGEAEGGAAKPKRQDPIEAERTIAAASQQLETGKSAEAAQALTRVLNGGGLPPAMMAKALLYRGMAYRQQKKPAQAIADLTSALWLKGGLGEADRADALKQRAAAYEEAGLADSGASAVPAVPNAARGARTASAVGASPEVAQSPPSSGGWSNPFAGWFGGASPAPSSPRQPEPPPTTASIETPPQAHAAPRATSPSGTKTSAWTSQTDMPGGSA